MTNLTTTLIDGLEEINYSDDRPHSDLGASVMEICEWRFAAEQKVRDFDALLQSEGKVYEMDPETARFLAGFGSR